jgi:hypothetical protein
VLAHSEKNVYSLTKTSVSADAIHEMVRHHFGTGHSIHTLQELKGGLYNAAYRIELEDGLACIPGLPLNKLRGSLSEPEQCQIDLQAGQLTRKINALGGPAFGYVAQPEHHTPSWRMAFEGMLEGVLADGVDARVMLPLPYCEIRDRVSPYYGVLDSIAVPQLVHCDLWDGAESPVPPSHCVRVRRNIATDAPGESCSQ